VERATNVPLENAMAAYLNRMLVVVALAAAAGLLPGCVGLGSPWQTARMVPALKIRAVREGMTYGQFEMVMGPGYLSPSAGTRDKYWFLDDTRIVAVPESVWQSPKNSVRYRIIGGLREEHAPANLLAAEPLLPKAGPGGR
jgi:hypothetical protein